jgi:hypothetical protein
VGLFDEVRCEYPLPNAAHQGILFQTKDLESLMDEYVITRRGRLVRTKRGRPGDGGASEPGPPTLQGC